MTSRSMLQRMKVKVACPRFSEARVSETFVLTRGIVGKNINSSVAVFEVSYFQVENLLHRLIERFAHGEDVAVSRSPLGGTDIAAGDRWIATIGKPFKPASRRMAKA